MSSFPFQDRESILSLAESYWTWITEREAIEERVFERELVSARADRFLTKPLFVRLARWKSTRNTRRYESNEEEEVRSATATALHATSDAEALLALMGLKGVGLPTASAILHWMRPDRFPILDFRVVGALGEPEPKNWNDLNYYCRIAERVRALASQQSIDLRLLDRALWTWQKAQARDRRP